MSHAGSSNAPVVCVEAVCNEDNWETLFGEGKYTLVLPYLLHRVAIAEDTSGPDHLDVATAMKKLSDVYNALGDFAASRLIAARALDIGEKTLGAHHIGITEFLCDLADVMTLQGECGAAHTLLVRALVIRETVLDPYDFQVAIVLQKLASSFANCRQWTTAQPLVERCVHIYMHYNGVHGRWHASLASAYQLWGSMMMDQGDFGAARELLNRALDIIKVEYRDVDNHHNKFAVLMSLASVNEQEGRLDQAQYLLEHILPKAEMEFGPHHPTVGCILGNLAKTRRIRQSQKFYETRACYRRGHARLGTFLFCQFQNEPGSYPFRESMQCVWCGRRHIEAMWTV